MTELTSDQALTAFRAGNVYVAESGKIYTDGGRDRHLMNSDDKLTLFIELHAALTYRNIHAEYSFCINGAIIYAKEFVPLPVVIFCVDDDKIKTPRNAIREYLSHVPCCIVDVVISYCGRWNVSGKIDERLVM